MTPQKHKWKITDDIVAFYLYKSGSKLEIDIAAKKLGIRITSIKMRVSNFAFLETKKGLRNYSKQSQNVFLKWKNSNLSELKAEYENIISQINR
jgi:hypothetical protein